MEKQSNKLAPAHFHLRGISSPLPFIKNRLAKSFAFVFLGKLTLFSCLTIAIYLISCSFAPGLPSRYLVVFFALVKSLKKTALPRLVL
jgi:hypothetical protein